MIRVLRRYQKTIFGVLVIAAAALAMGGFGLGRFLDKGESGRGRAAIKVNDTEISYEEFRRAERNIEARYRQMAGKMYLQFIKALNINVAQQAVDQLIANALLDQEMRKMGFTAGSEETAMYLRANFFPRGVDAASYASVLRDLGVTSEAFMTDVRGDVMRNQLVDMIREVSQPSEAEVRMAAEREETKYDVTCATFDPASFVAKVAVPDDAALQSYYEEDSARYELPERVSYEYSVLDAKDFESAIEIFPEDVEAFYTENSGRFELPDEMHVRAIRITKPKDAEALKAARERAQKAHDRAQSEDFAALVKEYSDDETTKLMGGDMGWVKRGTFGKDFDNKVFALQGAGLAEVVEAPNAFMVVKAEEYREKRAKPLEEVRNEIIAEIRTREAPTYASEQANKLLAEWSKSGASLKDFAAEKKLRFGTTELLQKGTDPEDLAGLTAKVLEMPIEDGQVIEVGTRSVIVKIKEHRDVETPALASVKDRVVSDLKQKLAADAAQAAAKGLLEQLHGGAAIEKAGVAAGASVKMETGIGTQSQDNPLFGDNAVMRELHAKTAPGLIDQAFSIGGKSYVMKVANVIKPSPEAIAAKVKTLREQVGQDNARVLVDSLVNTLKARATIDVDPTLTAREAEE